MECESVFVFWRDSLYDLNMLHFQLVVFVVLSNLWTVAVVLNSTSNILFYRRIAHAHVTADFHMSQHIPITTTFQSKSSLLVHP